MLTVKATSNFFKMRDKLIDAGLFSIEQYQATRDAFKKNPKDTNLRPHKISCKEGHTLISITILPKTQFRIMANMKDCDPTIAIFSWVGKHREYERIIKDKKNCRSLFVSCKDAVNDDPKEITPPTPTSASSK